MTSGKSNQLRTFLLFLVQFEILSPDMRSGVVKETKCNNFVFLEILRNVVWWILPMFRGMYCLHPEGRRVTSQKKVALILSFMGISDLMICRCLTTELQNGHNNWTEERWR